MIARIRAGSLTRLSLSAIGLCVPDSASVFGSVTVHPWKSRSPDSSSRNRAGQLSPSVSGSIAKNLSATVTSLAAQTRQYLSTLLACRRANRAEVADGTGQEAIV